MQPGRNHASHPAVRALIAVALAALVLASTPVIACARGASAPSFALALGDGATNAASLQRLSHYDVVVLDAENTSAHQVAAVRVHGARVLGYLSVGTIEPYRSWYPALAPYRLDRYDEWREWYANVASAGYRSKVRAIARDQLDAKGFDGLFIDNVDMVETHPSQATGMRLLVAGLSADVHSRGGMLYSQNGWAVTRELAGFLDGWNREDVVGTYDFDRSRYALTTREDLVAATGELRAARALGLLTSSTDYCSVVDRRVPTLSAWVARRAGAASFVSDIGLNRIPVAP